MKLSSFTQSLPKGDPVSIIRKEFVLLTGNHIHAVILGQLLYWTQRTKDFPLMLEEEKNKIRSQGGVSQEDAPEYGWIYKSAKELSEETLLSLDRTTIRRHLLSLINRGWVFEKGNPHHKWDKTRHYRLNVQKIQKDLVALGFSLVSMPLSGLEKLFLQDEQIKSESKIPSNIVPLPVTPETAETLSGHPALSNGQTPLSSGQDTRSKTEITIEITNKENTPRANCKKTFFEQNFFEEVLETWNIHVRQEGPREGSLREGSPSVHLTEERQRRISFLFPRYFQNDLSQWEACCKRIARSPFLMGQGERKWRISLDWVLSEENLLKVLEGNFDEGERIDEHTQKVSEEVRKKEISEFLTSIKDPLWQKVCSQLDFTLKSPASLSLGDLKILAKARLLEVEEDRLAWIGSADADVLSHIENLRFHLLSPLQRFFPRIRNLRTRLEDEKDSFQEEGSSFSSIPPYSHQHPQEGTPMPHQAYPRANDLRAQLTGETYAQ